MKKQNKYMTKADIIGSRLEIEKRLPKIRDLSRENAKAIYGLNDMIVLHGFSSPGVLDSVTALETQEELEQRDKQREKDGFEKKIKKAIIPSSDGKKYIIVPTAEEEKLAHGAFDPNKGDGDKTGGKGEGEEDEVIAEQPVDQQDEGEGSEPGGESGGEHGIDADIYKVGEKLTKEFELPNLKDKGKKFPTDKYTYDLTDRFKGAGQKVDIKATLRQIVKINQALGRLDPNDIDTTKFIFGNSDIIYRVLSREREYKSKAVVFFLRDYSGSMSGKPTEAIVTQHIMLFAWLMFQYETFVIPRFILHDTEAKEVPDFNAYYNAKVLGGTKVVSGYRLINKIIEEENLAQDYNIFVFQGTDGDDWDTRGSETIPELKKILALPVSRMGISIARNSYGAKETEVEKYIKKSKLLEQKDIFRMYSMSASEATEKKNIEAIKALIS